MSIRARFFLRNMLMTRLAPMEASLLSATGYLHRSRVRRTLLTTRYAVGTGIEVGAGAGPSVVALGTTVRFVDRAPKEVLEMDPELMFAPVVETDIIDDAERLSSIETSSQDFVIAFCVMEHVKDPLAAFEALHRVTKGGGVLLLSVPNRDTYALDSQRPVTTFKHLVDDHEHGPETSRESHFREAGTQGYNLTGDELEAFVNRGLADPAVHTHFHVWDSRTFVEFVRDAPVHLGVETRVLESYTAQNETGVALRVFK